MLDTSFNPGTDLTVLTLAVQADGKILVGGWFTTLNGQGHNSLGRLNPDGTLDTSFNPGLLPGSSVWSLSVQANGGILVGGRLSTLEAAFPFSICRLNSDGVLDPSFNPQVFRPGPAYPRHIASQYNQTPRFWWGRFHRPRRAEPRLHRAPQQRRLADPRSDLRWLDPDLDAWGRRPGGLAGELRVLTRRRQLVDKPRCGQPYCWWLATERACPAKELELSRTLLHSRRNGEWVGVVRGRHHRHPCDLRAARQPNQ